MDEISKEDFNKMFAALKDGAADTCPFHKHENYACPSFTFGACSSCGIFKGYYELISMDVKAAVEYMRIKGPNFKYDRESKIVFAQMPDGKNVTIARILVTDAPAQIGYIIVKLLQDGVI